MINNTLHYENIVSPVRSVKARVELYNGSTLLHTFSDTDRLKEFTVERVGESKFFGFGICQRLNIKLIDIYRNLSVATDYDFLISIGANDNYLNVLPRFHTTEVNRDENTNELSITAYDELERAAKHTVSELFTTQTLDEDDGAPVLNYSILDFAILISEFLGLGLWFEGITDNCLETYYEGGANFDGTETLREALNALAEATQTVYYINPENKLVFKRLDNIGEPITTIDREQYITLDSKTNRRLSKIMSATELGDNVSAEIDATGTTQYVRDNPFWDMRDDIDVLLHNAINAVGGLTINQFEMDWRGNYLIEIGDKLELITKEGMPVNTFLLDDTITYDGTYNQKTRWSFEDNEAETVDNPATLGDALKQTFAKVDKVNKEINLVAGETNENSEAISAIQVNTQSINASVSQIEENMNNGFNEVNEKFESLKKSVEAILTSEDLQILIKQEIQNGVDKVITSTGFTFDENGLNVSKTDSEMSTQITEDGMVVYRDNEAVLTADNTGVYAENLHATTYLIIGTCSRFEDYDKDGNKRTGCFWIGG